LPAATAAAVAAKGGACPQNMKLVPGGTSTVGSDEGNFPLYKPAHRVTLDTYCLSANEVTVREYTSCVKAGDCKAPAKLPDYPRGKVDADEHRRNLEAFGELCNYGRSSRTDHPINCVDWHQADAYCKAQGHRLPSEAEWEFAARGNDGRQFPWGDDPGNQSYMNAGGLEWKAWKTARDLEAPPGTMYQAEDGYAGTAPVGSFPRGQSQTGQLDMVGNVWEWTADWYALYDDAPATNPRGPSAGNRKAIRGGGFNGSFELWMNPAFRYHQLATASSHALGFRCASDVADAR
jgi:formylglycine-generating enzyme required for sulfatase activity